MFYPAKKAFKKGLDTVFGNDKNEKREGPIFPLGLLALFKPLNSFYPMDMKKYSYLLTLVITSLFVGFNCLMANEIYPSPKKIIRRMKVDTKNLRNTISRTYYFRYLNQTRRFQIPFPPHKFLSKESALALPTLTSVSKSSLNKKILQIIQRSPAILNGLTHVQDFQYNLPGAPNLPVQLLFTRYYEKFFGVQTPHVKMFLERVSLIWNEKLERDVLSRMEFLKDFAPQIIDQLHLGPVPQHAIRLRYMKDVTLLTARNFHSADLVLSIEQKMTGNPKVKLPINNIQNTTQVQVGGHMYPLYNYNGPLENLHEMYSFLIVGNSRKSPIFVTFDEKNKSLLVANMKKTRWLRITPHEYKSSSSIHIHLNDRKTVSLSIPNLDQWTEHVNINLSIPFDQPEEILHLPSGVTPQDYLYQKLIVEPVQSLEKMPNAFVIRQSIF